MTLERRPLVTVVIPTRNRSHHIAAAVETVLDQSWRRVEVVVVDDASEDQTPEVIASLLATHPRVRAIRNPERQGAAAARNTGVRLGSGSLVAFNDDDCTWSRVKLERQVESLREPDVGVAYCPMWLKLEERRWRKVAIPDAETAPRTALLKRSFIPTPTVLMRMDLFRNVGGFDECLPALQDWDLMLRLSTLTRFRFVDDVEVRSEYLEGGISDQPSAVVEASRRIRAKHLDGELDPSARSRLHGALGHVLMTSGHPREGRRMFTRALLEAPATLRPWFLAGVSLLGRRGYRLMIRWREQLQGTLLDDVVSWFWK